MRVTHATATTTLAVPTVPAPCVTVQVWLGLVGCVSTVTAYGEPVVRGGPPNAKEPFAVSVTLSPPSSCSTTEAAVASPVRVPVSVKGPVAGGASLALPVSFSVPVSGVPAELVSGSASGVGAVSSVASSLLVSGALAVPVSTATAVSSGTAESCPVPIGASRVVASSAAGGKPESAAAESTLSDLTSSPGTASYDVPTYPQPAMVSARTIRDVATEHRLSNRETRPSQPP